MSAVYIIAWLSGAVLVGNLLVKWHEAAQTDDVIRESLDETTQLQTLPDDRGDR